MSSFVGHAGAGMAVFLCRARPLDRRAAVILGVLVLLAIAPDLDYLAWWCCRIQSAPRWTHSLAFCLALAGLASLPGVRWRAALGDYPGFSACALAACSHIVLDWLVGVHPLPVLWPLPLPQASAPFGILPSAGHLSLTNYYFWRNLLIETGILLPLYALAVALARQVPARRLGRWALLAIPVWTLCLAWSLRVHG